MSPLVKTATLVIMEFNNKKTNPQLVHEMGLGVGVFL